MGSALAGLLAGGGDQAPLLEGGEGAVHQRLGERPHPADLALAGHQSGQREAVAGLLGDQAEDRPLAAGERWEAWSR